MGETEEDHLVSEPLERIFPGLRDAPYEITSPAQPDYNCVAWAAGNDSHWWWPDAAGQYYWPENAPRREAMETFVQAFQELGFEVCEGPSLEPGWEKVAIYARDDGVPRHAARQLPDGRWTSKLGALEDIVHPGLEHVSGEAYGRPIIILRRRRQKLGSEEETP